jgi:rhodanese-related sulfurtransferase
VTEAFSTPTPDERLREALREGIVVALVAAAIGLFYNAVAGKGIFGAPATAQAAASPSTRAPEIIPLETAVRLHTGGDAFFVDSRHQFDFRLGHIPGAVCIPLQESDTIIARTEWAKDRPVVVYCDGAECNSSLEVAAKFSAAGFDSVYVFFAGWNAWLGSGQPTAQGTR